MLRRSATLGVALAILLAAALPAAATPVQRTVLAEMFGASW